MRQRISRQCALLHVLWCGLIAARNKERARAHERKGKREERKSPVDCTKANGEKTTHRYACGRNNLHAGHCDCSAQGLCFPKGGYAFDFDAYQCLEEPLEELYQDGFSDAASGQYEAAVLAALPEGVDIDRVDVSTDTLLSSSQELRDLVESVTTDESDSPLSFYVDLNSSVDEIGNDMLAKIESEMRSLGVDKDVSTGYKIELKVNVDTYKDTPLIKDDQNKVFDVKDIGVYTIEIGDRWYLWPLQEK